MRDTESIGRAVAGDPEAREALARAWMRPVYAVALAITRRPADADEVTQETFLRAFRRLRRLRDPARFGPWLTQIARNAARDLLRRRQRATAPLVDDVEGEDVTDALDTAAVRAWRDLPDAQRLVCWLHVMHDMSFREIAELLDQSKSRVDRTYRKGMAQLRREVFTCTTEPTT